MKRKHPSNSAPRRRHDRNKFRRANHVDFTKRQLSSGLTGFLFSCTPHHERDAFFDAVALLSSFCDESQLSAPPALNQPDTAISSHKPEQESQPHAGPESVTDADAKPEPNSVPDETSQHQTKPSHPATDTPDNPPPTSAPEESKPPSKTPIDELDDELKSMKKRKSLPFTRIDPGVNGAIFASCSVNMPIEQLVESALRSARTTGNAGTRHCVRILPIHTTCYAKPSDVAEATSKVVRNNFPALPPADTDEGKSKVVTFAVVFRARANSGAHRADYIPQIAGAVEAIDSRYKVDLTKPDVTVLVEILKTTCFLGTFRHFYDFAKMNLRECACPSPKSEPAKKPQNYEPQQARTSLPQEEKPPTSDRPLAELAEPDRDGTSASSPPERDDQKAPISSAAVKDDTASPNEAPPNATTPSIDPTEDAGTCQQVKH